MKFFSFLFMLLLAYIIAALVFWGFSLNKQSEKIYQLENIHLRSQLDSLDNPDLFNKRVSELNDKRMMRKKQYWGEGSTFLLVIFVGAAIVYTSFRRSIRLSRQQNNFMLSVTHELKSPIAAMKLNLQTLDKYKLDEQKQNLLIDKCIRESNRLNDLCNNMLLASQMEGRQIKAARERLSLTELVETAVKSYSHNYPGRFSAYIADHIGIAADKFMLQMAIHNLLENAVKYSPPDTTITVNLVEKNGLAILQVIDEGVGVPEQEKHKIFRKFYRLGSEDTRKTKGTGLGLYLTQKIIWQHKGKIVVRDNIPKGSIFEMSLPTG